MRILDRYILKSIFNILLICIFTFFLLYIVIDIFTHIEDILKQKIGIGILSQYYLAFLPLIFIQVTPVACFLSTLFTFGKLNHTNELIAMRASGLSVYQITKTLTTLGIVITLLVFLVNDRLLPPSLALTQRIREHIETGSNRHQKNEYETINNLSMYGLKNRLFFIAKFYPQQNTIEGINILEHDEHQNIIRKIVATNGAYADNTWKFYKSITYNFDNNGQVIGEPQYLEEEIVPIPETPKDFLTQRQQPEFMSIAQLDDYLWKLSKSGATSVTRNLKIELYKRFTDPFTSIIIILMGIPFSFRMGSRRAAGLSMVGLSILICFFYYVLNAVGIALGRAGVLPPFIAASASHIILLITSLHLIKKLR